MKHTIEYFLLCENIIIGERSKLSLINLYDQVYAETTPVNLSVGMYFVFSAFLTNESENELALTFNLKIKSPGGSILQDIKSDSAAPLAHDAIDKKVGAGFGIASFNVTELGKYTAELHLNGGLIATKTFEVTNDAPENLNK